MICPRTSDYDFFHARLSIHLSSIHREARKGSGDNDPGNSHSRAACGTPCDSRRSAGLLRPLGAPGSGSPGRVWGSSPIVSYQENQVSEQGATRPTIETASFRPLSSIPCKAKVGSARQSHRFSVSADMRFRAGRILLLCGNPGQVSLRSLTAFPALGETLGCRPNPPRDFAP